MEAENRSNKKHQLNILQLLMFRYFPYWPLFIGLGVLMFLLALLYLQVASPIYEATATILIKDEKKGVADPSMVESLNIYTSKKIVENEIEVIKSKTLMRQTVDLLQLAAPVFEERMFSSYSAYTTSPITVEVKDINDISELPRADFFYDEAAALVRFNNKMYHLDEWISSPNGTVRFVKNSRLLERGTGPFYFSLVDPRKVTNQLIKNLNVDPSSKLSTVVNLSIRDAVPLRAENILNTLMESYNRAAINDKNSLAANTLEFLEARIKLVEHDLDSVERTIEQYKSTRGIVDLSEQGKLFLKNVGENDQKLSELNIQLAVLDKVNDYVVRKNNAARIVPSTLGIFDQRLSSLIQKLYDSEIQYERLKKTTAENNPILLALQSEIENLRPSILENIRNQRFSLIASKTKLASTNDQYSSVLETIPEKERELLEVNRQQSIKSKVYTFLLQKREETALSYASTIGDSRLVDRAESSLLPVAPKKIMIFAEAMAFAFFLGIAWVTIGEFFTSKVLFRSEIETHTKIPIAAEISYAGFKDYIVVNNPKKPFFTEQFRQLRTAVGLYGKPSTKILMVTSAISGEGKSFISANLATSLARSTKKVLLVDLDLRNPKLSNLYNLDRVAGVAEVLLGSSAINEVINSTKISNLYMVSAGQELTNTTDILLNGNLQDLFKKLQELFDYIIVDTAPVDPVIDAYIVSPYCDATLFVVRHGKTPKTMLHLLNENNKVKALNNISIVFNGVRSRGLIKSTYGYGYGFGYENVYLDRQRIRK